MLWYQPLGNTTILRAQPKGTSCGVCLYSLGTGQGAWPLLPEPAVHKALTLQPVTCVPWRTRHCCCCCYPGPRSYSFSSSVCGTRPTTWGSTSGLHRALDNPFPKHSFCTVPWPQKRDFPETIPAWISEPVGLMSLPCTPHCSCKKPHSAFSGLMGDLVVYSVRRTSQPPATMLVMRTPCHSSF